MARKWDLTIPRLVAVSDALKEVISCAVSSMPLNINHKRVDEMDPKDLLGYCVKLLNNERFWQRHSANNHMTVSAKVRLEKAIDTCRAR